jgi:HEAT repeat protein
LQFLSDLAFGGQFALQQSRDVRAVEGVQEMTIIRNRMLTTQGFGSLILILIIFLSTANSRAQVVSNPGWPLLEAGLAQENPTQRLGAVRVLGLIPDDSHAAELAEKALQDPNSSVRAAAATSLGQMHAQRADRALKQALNDKKLAVVLAAAHALRLLNDPACYEVYYAVFTGGRKNDSGMIAQEMKVLHDPKQVAAMGLNEGIGFVPFAGIGWEAFQTIMKDKKSGVAAKAALISVLATDPDARTNELLVEVSENQNWVLRVAALEAMAKRENPALVPEIEPGLDDPRREVRYTAAATVIHLTDVAKAHAGALKSVHTTEAAKILTEEQAPSSALRTTY